MLTITGSFLAFDQFYIMTQGGPGNETLTAVMWIYTTSFIRYRLGYGATLAIALLVLLLGLSVTQIMLLRERAEH